MTHIFAPFTVIFIVLRKLPLLFVKQKMRLPKLKIIQNRQSVTNTVFRGMVRRKCSVEMT